MIRRKHDFFIEVCSYENDKTIQSPIGNRKIQKHFNTICHLRHETEANIKPDTGLIPSNETSI